MNRDKLITASGRIITALVLVALTVLFIFLASKRGLPFMSENEQEYSKFQASDTQESGDTTSSDNDSSYVSENGEKTFDEIISEFSKHTENPISYSIFNPEKHSLELIDVYSFTGENISSLSIEMGFIQVTEGDGSYHIYLPNGDEITELVSDKELTHYRTASGEPLFVNSSKKYFYIDENGELVKTDFNPETDGTGFECETPRYLGVQNSEVFKFRQSNGFGYKTNSKIIVGAFYNEAFAFSDEGVGCVLRKSYNTERFVFFNKTGLTLNKDYYAPEVRDESALGYFYFDDGLIRVRRKNEDNTFSEIIIDTKMKELQLPADYRIAAYSDSRILLEKNGLYGYMTSGLTWITLPEFSSAKPFYEGLAVVKKDGGKGVIDKNGSFVIPAVFDEISDCSDGLILAYSEQNGYFVFAKVQK